MVEFEVGTDSMGDGRNWRDWIVVSLSPCLTYTDRSFLGGRKVFCDGSPSVGAGIRSTLGLLELGNERPML